MATSILKKGDKKVIRAWAFYDCANSAYSLVITSALFPIYFNAVTTTEGSKDVFFLGRTFNSDSLQTYSISLAFLFIAGISPLLSSIADCTGYKKRFMFYNIVGSILWSFTMIFAGHYLHSLFLNQFHIDLKHYIEYIVIGIILVTTFPVLLKLLRKKK